MKSFEILMKRFGNSIIIKTCNSCPSIGLYLVKHNSSSNIGNGGVKLLNQRSVAILQQVLKSYPYISVEELAELFNVSRRTIYNDLEKIDDWLKENYSTELIRVRGKGLYLDPELKSKIFENEKIPRETYYEFSKEERQAWLYIYIVGQHEDCYLQDFQNLLQVSRNTIIDDIKSLRGELKKRSVELLTEMKAGYQVSGDEITVRSYLMQYLTEVIPQEMVYKNFKNSDDPNEQYAKSMVQPYKILSEQEITCIQTYLNEYEQFVEVEITDEVRNNLIIWFYFFIKRIKQGHYAMIDPAEKEVIHTTEEFKGAKRLCEKLSHSFNVDIPIGEVIYITRFLLSAKVNYNLNVQFESLEMKNLTEVVEKMVRDFQKYAAVDFPEPDLMIHNLLLHLKPTYYRKKYGIEINNILKNTIKRNYPEIFHLTKNVIHHIENLMGQKIDENEIAFIAMHFGGWLRQEGVDLTPEKKKMLIVCTNGLGTSQILKTQLTTLFSNVDITDVISLREYEEIIDITNAADFIVSTILLPDRGIPVFVVDPILTNNDKAQLLRKVSGLIDHGTPQQVMSIDTMMEIVNRYADIQNGRSLKYELEAYIHSFNMVDTHENNVLPDLLELMPQSRIEVKDRVNGWEEAIFQASSPLLEKEFITKNYIEEMIQIVKRDGPYIVISDGIALPHANSEKGVNQTGMSMLLLKEKIDLVGKPVRMFIVLASIDNERHLKALSQLTQLFSNKTLKEKIMQSNRKQELTELIKQNIPIMRSD